MNKVTEKAISLVESPFLRPATVLAVRNWVPDTVREIDLHLPDCDMNKWTTAQHLKCKVGALAYRDYTPSGWDVETQTCTLIIHIAHSGPGSRWVRGLEAGDTIHYLGAKSSHHEIKRDRPMVFLGDETTIGHFQALRQMAGKDASISGAIALVESHHQQEFGEYFPDWNVEPLQKQDVHDHHELSSWIGGLKASDHSDSIFYLAGHIPSVIRMRKLLRQRGFAGGQVQAQGFWD
jgi:NADPH-dependent ferric siderophore reductase